MVKLFQYTFSNIVWSESLSSSSLSSPSSLEMLRSLKGSDDDGFDDNQSNNTSGDNHNDSRVLKATILLYGSTFLLIGLVFCWARKRFPRVYQLRKWIENERTATDDNDDDDPQQVSRRRGQQQQQQQQEDKGFLSWIWQVHEVRDDEILRKCGMDALCFIRIARFGYKLR